MERFALDCWRGRHKRGALHAWCSIRRSKQRQHSSRPRWPLQDWSQSSNHRRQHRSARSQDPDCCVPRRGSPRQSGHNRQRLLPRYRRSVSVLASIWWIWATLRVATRSGYRGGSSSRREVSEAYNIAPEASRHLGHQGTRHRRDRAVFGGRHQQREHVRPALP